MRHCLFAFFLLLLTSHTNAQLDRKGFNLDLYQHTLNYPDHKITFYAASIGETLKFTDPAKKYYWFTGNQLNITQGGFGGKLLQGRYSDFYLNKNLKEQGEFSMGLKKGEWHSWTADGILTSSIRYKKGVMQGPFFRYDSTGYIAEKGRYHEGRISGKLKKYVTIDSTVIINYKNGIVRPTTKRGNWFKKFFKKSKTVAIK